MGEIVFAIGVGVLLSIYAIRKRRDLITLKNTCYVFLIGTGIFIFAILVSGTYGGQTVFDILAMNGTSRMSRRTVHAGYSFFVIGFVWLGYLGINRSKNK